MKPVKLIVAGAGDRGTCHSEYAAIHPDLARVVGVGEPRGHYRERLAAKHNIPADNVFADWQAMAAREKFADAVIIATQDAMHAAPAVAFARKGYHVLLEKPMATTEADCREIVRAVEAAGVIFGVCHVLRYTDYTRKLKSLIDDGLIGDVVSIQHFEPVGYWHQAHSFVRGNWRNEKESSFMLLAKSCHDLDWIRYIMGDRCTSISSFGSLYHFRKEHQPAGAADRCVNCGVEADCPYSARRFYMSLAEKGQTGWPLDVIATDPTPEGVLAALETGPYGRCVYCCDNDVVDNQVVSMQFAGGQTAVFTMTAFNKADHRKTRIFGTRGEIYGDGEKIHHFDFLTNRPQEINTQSADATITGGHGGGDYRIMQRFIDAVANNDPGRIISGPRETLESHLMVFAAEKARRENKVVEI